MRTGSRAIAALSTNQRHTARLAYAKNSTPSRAGGKAQFEETLYTTSTPHYRGPWRSQPSAWLSCGVGYGFLAELVGTSALAQQDDDAHRAVLIRVERQPLHGMEANICAGVGSL
jgi:hypothetical protein